jgi:hypothetical protein
MFFVLTAKLKEPCLSGNFSLMSGIHSFLPFDKSAVYKACSKH